MNTAADNSRTTTREELYELIWQEPMTKVAPQFGVSDVGLAKICKRYDIPRPPVGYWAKKEVGKAPERTPLPPLEEESEVTISFSIGDQPETVAATDLVVDEDRKRLIAYEQDPRNCIKVTEQLTKPHSIVQDTKSSLSRPNTDRQGLLSPSWSERDATLDVHVAAASIPRALVLLDALVKAFEQRGHKIVGDKTQYHRQLLFTFLGEKFTIRLREKTKMVPVPLAEQKRRPFGPKVDYVPTGLLELQVHNAGSGYSFATWKDGKRDKLEDCLNDVMIELIMHVQRARNRHKAREAAEKREREVQARRQQLEQERAKQEQRIQDLYIMADHWERAGQVRSFLAAIRSTFEQRRQTIDEGSELAQWMDWASKHAAAIDPLTADHGGQRTTCAESDRTEAGTWRPNHPR